MQFQPEGDLSLYDDEDTRQFYENLPDLRAIIPGVSKLSFCFDWTQHDKWSKLSVRLVV